MKVSTRIQFRERALAASLKLGFLGLDEGALLQFRERALAASLKQAPWPAL